MDRRQQAGRQGQELTAEATAEGADRARRTGEVVYALGHAPREIRRLELQAEFLRPLTLQLLDACGLARGMRVLDIGTGAGDVAMLAAGVVGPNGSVLGIDRSGDVLARARDRAAAAGLGQVCYEQADLAQAGAFGSFDLVIGRYVLVHQADRVAFLRNAAALVAGGGRLALIEPATRRGDSFACPALDLYADILAQIHDAFGAAGAELAVGTRLVGLFAAADLAEPQLMSAAPVGGPSSHLPEWLTETWTSMLPTLAKAGRVPAIDPGSALARLRETATAGNAQLFGPRSVAAWTRVGEPTFNRPRSCGRSFRGA